MKSRHRTPAFKRWSVLLIIVILVLGVAACAGSEDAAQDPTAATETTPITTPEETTGPTEPEVSPTAESDELSLQHGELLDVTINSIDNIAVIKAKIQPSYSTRATIVQNYLNVCDLIQDHGFDQYNEVQYWAVADMTDGSEQKVISFTVTADLIQMIAEDDGFVENDLGEYEIDLWLHASLR